MRLKIGAYWYLTVVELAGFVGMIMGGMIMSTWGGFRSRVTTMVAGLAALGTLAWDYQDIFFCTLYLW